MLPWQVTCRHGWDGLLQTYLIRRSSVDRFNAQSKMIFVNHLVLILCISYLSNPEVCRCCRNSYIQHPSRPSELLTMYQLPPTPVDRIKSRYWGREYETYPPSMMATGPCGMILVDPITSSYLAAPEHGKTKENRKYA